MKTHLHTAGFTLLEFVLSVFIALIAIHAATLCFRAAQYNGIEARLKERTASQLKYEAERMSYMPYSSLSTLAASGSDVSTGFLYQPSNGAGGFNALYPYTLSATLAVYNAGSKTERIDIATVISWQEPSPDFTAGNATKQLTLSTVSRYRF